MWARYWGPYSKGLVSIGLAESLFEKGGNVYKVLELANRGLMETMNGGKFELEFVGAALVARVYLVTGHPGDSVKTLEEIETRAQQRGARRVVRNVRAMQSRIKLWQGWVEDAVRWMENEPQNEIHFNVLERYCYNTFVRVYMAQQRYDKTAQILMRLRSYANMEKRPWAPDGGRPAGIHHPLPHRESAVENGADPGAPPGRKLPLCPAVLPGGRGAAAPAAGAWLPGGRGRGLLAGSAG